MAAMTEHSKFAEKYQQHRKFFYLFVCVLTIILSIVGISVTTTSSTQTEDQQDKDNTQNNYKLSQDLYIVILVFCLVCLIVELTWRLLRNSGAQSKYEVSERKEEVSEKKVEKKDKEVTNNGVENKAFDAEKGEGGVKDEKWVKNYVPYDDYPAGNPDTVTVESDTTGEEKRREEEKGEKENKEGEKGDEKWKDNYVPYEEDKE